MEEKNETGQGDKDSGAPEAKSSAASANVADKLIADVKKFNMMSLIGLGIVIAFLLFLFISALAYKWWLMLPLAGAAAFILYRQLSDTQGFEKKACYYGLIVIGVLVLFRDIQISNAMEGFRSTIARVSQMSNALNKVKIPSINLPTK